MPHVRSYRRSTLRSAALVVAALSLAAPQAGAQREVDGYRYTFRILTGDGEPMTGSAWVVGDQARIELDRSADAANDGAKGVRRRRDIGVDDHYLVVTDGGRTLLAVTPSEREYSSTGVDDFERLVGTAMQAADKVLTMEVSDLSVTGRRIGPGGPVLGHSTQRGRLVADYVARVGALGFTARLPHHVESDYWVAPDLELPRNPLAELMVGLPTALAQHDRDFVARMTAGRRTLVGRGTPLKVVLTSTSRDTGGKSKTAITSYEITSLTRAKVDPALFAVPKGYSKTDGFNWSVGNRK